MGQMKVRPGNAMHRSTAAQTGQWARPPPSESEQALCFLRWKQQQKSVE
jgi:hypothetical protein